MSIDRVLNVGWSGIWIGCEFGAIGVALVLAFRACRVIDLSLGQVFVFAAMLAAWLQAKGASPAAAAIAGTAVGTGLAVGQEHLLLRRLENATPSILLMATLAVAITLSGLSAVFFGRDPVSGAGLVGPGYVQVRGWRASWDSIVFVALVLLLTAAIGWFVSFSAFGKTMSAAGDDPGAARMLGIDVWSLRLAGMALAGTVAAAAGVLFLPLGVLDFTLGLRLTLFGFVAAAIVGYESVPGALLGGWLFGLVDAFGRAWVSSVFGEAVAFGALIAVILTARRLRVIRTIFQTA